LLGINALLTTSKHIFLSETGSEEMDETAQQRAHVMGHDGRRLTLADLPPPSTERWVIRRKAEVIAAVRGGLLSLEEACSRYTLNTDEFRSWEFCIDRYGLAGPGRLTLNFTLTVSSGAGGFDALESLRNDQTDSEVLALSRTNTAAIRDREGLRRNDGGRHKPRVEMQILRDNLDENGATVE
jgi:hypothetical protein